MPALPSSVNVPGHVQVHGDPESDAYKASVDAAWAALRALPQHSFNVLLVDPPWDYGNKHYNGPAYNGMSLDEIIAMKSVVWHLIDPRKGALLLWTTGPMLERAMRVMREWGFYYKTVFLMWHKVRPSGKDATTWGAHYTRPSCEYLLVGTTSATRISHLRNTDKRTVFQYLPSDPQPLRPDIDYDALPIDTFILECIREGHSVKPLAAMERIEAYFRPEMNKIELFARNTRPGWTAWGIEVDGYVVSQPLLSASQQQEQLLLGQAGTSEDAHGVGNLGGQHGRGQKRPRDVADGELDSRPDSL